MMNMVIISMLFYLSCFYKFADGVYLVLLMGLLEGYFVPLFNFFLTPEHFDQKVGYILNRTHFNLLQIVYSELLTGLDHADLFSHIGAQCGFLF